MQIEILDYPVQMKLGYRQEERYHLQRVLITLRADLAGGVGNSETDSLKDTLDYGAIAGKIDEVLEGKEFFLVETVVNLLGRELTTSFPVIKKVWLSVEKTSLPQGIMKTARVRCIREFGG